MPSWLPLPSNILRGDDDDHSSIGSIRLDPPTIVFHEWNDDADWGTVRVLVREMGEWTTVHHETYSDYVLTINDDDLDHEAVVPEFVEGYLERRYDEILATWPSIPPAHPPLADGCDGCGAPRNHGDPERCAECVQLDRDLAEAEQEEDA